MTNRERDALVAIKVMGFPVWNDEYHTLYPPYSTSIAAAWPVFKKFTSRYLWYDDATDVWHCHLDSTRRVMADCRSHATSEDDDGCQAICLAALKAVGVEGPE